MAAALVLVVSTSIASPNAKIFSNLLCYSVNGLTSMSPLDCAIPESISSLKGFEGGLITAEKKSFSIVSPESTFLKVAIFSPY